MILHIIIGNKGTIVKRKELTGSLVCFVLLLFAAVVWTAPVPDTGQTKCYNATVEIPCPSLGQDFYGQDGSYTINPISYTKLDAGGNALPDSVTEWIVVRDNVTGLIWEMKTNKDGSSKQKAVAGDGQSRIIMSQIFLENVSILMGG